MENIKIADVESGLGHYKDQLDKIISKEKLIREVGFAVQAANSNKKLLECTRASIIKCVYNVALTGLSLNPIKKEAAMVPKYINGEWQAILFPMYQGIAKLLTDTGSVTSIQTAVVFQGDEFEYELGLRQDLVHKPKHKSKVIEYAYAIGRLADGTFMIEVMDLETLDYIRDCSETWKAYKKGNIKEGDVIWIKWHDEMCRKSVLKRLCKSLPKTEQWKQVQEAINLDDEEYTISHNQEDYLLSLINTSSYDDDMKAIMERKVTAGLNPTEFEVMKKDLVECQVNPVHAGHYNQKELSTHLKNVGQDNRKGSGSLFEPEK